MPKKLQIVILLVTVLILGMGLYGSYYFWQKSMEKANQKPCTMEAKLCPDGSAVGRSGPNCEFAACPAPQPDPIAGWQTYRNELYGFEVKYPNNWKVFGTNKDATIDIMSYDIYDPRFEKGNASGVKIQIQSQSISRDTTLDSFIPPLDELTGQPVKADKITLNNYEARKADIGGATVYYVLSGNVGVRIIVFSPIADNLDGTKNQILSSFKFISSDPTASWQTYSGDGFEFKYPENFGADIWRAFEWPPKTTAVPINEGVIKKGCPNILDDKLFEGSPVALGGMNYQLYKMSDAAAGSTYTTYCYVTQKEQKNYAIQFVIRYTSGCGESCGPYCGTENEALCRNFDKVKEVEKPIEQMMATFRFIK